MKIKFIDITLISTCWAIAAILLLLSIFFESSILGLLTLFVFNNLFSIFIDNKIDAKKSYIKTFSICQLLIILSVYITWIIPSDFFYYQVNEGFDPLRYDFLARNSDLWSIADLTTSNFIIFYIYLKYQIFGENIFVNGEIFLLLLNCINYLSKVNSKFAVASLFSIIFFPDFLLYCGIPSKEPFTFLACYIFMCMVVNFRPIKSSLTSLILLSVLISFCIIIRPQLLLIFVLTTIFMINLKFISSNIIKLVIVFIALITIPYLFPERFSDISTIAELTAKGENTVSFDPLKGAIRDMFTSIPGSIEHLIYSPLRFIAYLVAPFPIGGFFKFFYNVNQFGLSIYEIPLAILTWISFISIVYLGLNIHRVYRGRLRFILHNPALILFFISLVFLVFYSPLLHIRYRVPFLPLLYLALYGHTTGGMKIYFLIAAACEFFAFAILLITLSFK